LRRLFHGSVILRSERATTVDIERVDRVWDQSFWEKKRAITENVTSCKML